MASLTQRRLVAQSAMGDSGARLLHLLGNQRVERQFHLIDRDVVGIHLGGFFQAAVPVLVRLADHPRNQIDVDLRETRLLNPFVSLENLRREMRPAVLFEDLIVEVFHAQRHPRDADLFEGLDFLQASACRVRIRR